MGAVADEKPDYKVIPTPKRSWLGRWWLWFFVVVFVGIFACYQWNHYQKEKFNNYLLELDQHGIKVEVNWVNEHPWVVSYEKYLPSFVIDLVASQKISVTFAGDEITANSLKCLAKLPNVTSVAFMDTPNLDDASFAHLSDVPSLTALVLINTPISRAGLIHLENVPTLGRIRIRPKNPVTEDLIDQLLAMKPTIDAEGFTAESVKLEVLEMTVSSGAQSVKVGDYVGFRGSFTSTHFAPDDTPITYFRLGDGTEADGSQNWQIAQGASGTKITSGTNGVFQFATHKMDFNKPGRYRAEIGLSVTRKIDDQVRASHLQLTLAVKEFEVKKK